MQHCFIKYRKQNRKGKTEMGVIEHAIKVARKYYDETTYYHVMRVAAYVVNDNLIPGGRVMERCVVLAIMHDLQEDTEFNYLKDSGEDFYDTYIEKCLELLTRDKEKVSYEDYLKNIKDNYNSYPEAYWVKMADMKDHLSEKDTLTDKLKEKYLNALSCLL